MISKDEISGFIKLGEIERFHQENDAKSIVGLRLGFHPTEWAELGQVLNHDELKYLIRGIVYFSIAGGHSGGSVSPVIQLFGVYAERFPLQEPELCQWITENRSNDYEPFGTCDHGGACTLAEYHSYQLRKQAESDKRVKAELESQKVIKEAKLKREKAAATQNLWNAVRRGDVSAVEALLQKGADWRSVVEEKGSLMELAKLTANQSLIELLAQHSIN
jgi:hypothetical protein